MNNSFDCLHTPLQVHVTLWVRVNDELVDFGKYDYFLWRFFLIILKFRSIWHFFCPNYSTLLLAPNCRFFWGRLCVQFRNSPKHCHSLIPCWFRNEHLYHWLWRYTIGILDYCNRAGLKWTFEFYFVNLTPPIFAYKFTLLGSTL